MSKRSRATIEADEEDEKETKTENETEKEEKPKDCLIDLGKNKKVTIGSFKGTVFVNIREYYEKDGKSLPGKKGITLSPEQWNLLIKNAQRINDALGK